MTDIKIDDNPMIVGKLETAKSSLPQTLYMKHGIINKFPSLTLIVGRSGSGKSNLAAWMLTHNEFMGGFFDDIYLFSATARADDLVEHLKLGDKHICDDLSMFAVDKLRDIISVQDAKIKKKGIKSVALDSKILIICDDCISEKAFIKSDILIKLATAGRHSLISTMICSQSYTKVPRVVRLQSQGLVLFPSSNDELELLNQDICPPGASKRDFLELIKHATADEHNFLFVNQHAVPKSDKFRKNFDTILNI